MRRRLTDAGRTTAARIRLLRLLSRAGLAATGTLVTLQLVRAVVPTAQALSVGHLVAVFGAGHSDRRVLVAAALVAGLFLIDHAVWLVLTAVRTLVVKRVDGRLRAEVRAIAVNLPGLDHLEGRSFQDRASRVVDGGMGLGRDRSAGSAAAGQLELVFRMLSAFAAAALLATFLPTLAFGLLLVSLLIRAMLRRQWMRIIDLLDADTAGQRKEYYLSEQAVIGAAKDVRLFGLSGWFGGRVRATATRTYAPVYREMLAVLRRQWWTALLAVGSATAALTVPAVAVLSGSLDPAQLITFVLAAWGVMSISSVGMEAYDIEYGLRGVEAADELTAEYGTGAAGAAGREAPSPTPTPPTVRFEDVVFTYPGTSAPVLDGLTVTLRPGETVAVVGENGVGKTTFVKLLGGLYRPDSGRITVDGVDLAALDLPAWRRRLAVLFGDFVRYPASLRENVTFAAPHLAGDDAVRDALDRAGGTRLLAELADGLDTSLWSEGTDGTGLSGGQWQRVALARVLFAVAAGGRVLVLDEPTAHLDVRAEAEFHQRVVSRVHNTTTVLISHRLSTVRPADRIILLRAGRVAEDGSHDELMALGGDYARFFTVQAEAFTVEAR
ncbi:ABC transporter ATP-binding protein [Plantactinospora soyae]|uniref:ATP-binding cassette subfamily B protein n=1 Tax=Plantactinospora soyae TaxID=1544732 RepID=A0A927MBW7_9ACTN|nr:ABC transporter ATP-binding protein [Plantactinospora soyae]MBE1491737.1 ATP-binding cassette subfamily B protein [Plantactinospora soyae]